MFVGAVPEHIEEFLTLEVVIPEIPEHLYQIAFIGIHPFTEIMIPHDFPEITVEPIIIQVVI